MEGPDEGDLAQPDVTDVEAAIAAIREADGRWQPGAASTFGGVTWRPHLVRDDRPIVLHVHLADTLRPYLLERLSRAFEDGHEVHLAAPLAALYDEESLQRLGEIDTIVHVLEGNTVSKPARLLAVVADRGVRVSQASRIMLGSQALELALLQTPRAGVKGSRLEALVTFLLSQIPDFRVVERNLRVATEELDAVVQQLTTEGRCWALGDAPFILVEAKNRAEKTDQQDLSVFRAKLQTKRGTARLGLMISTAGFTGDALLQEMKFASGNITIACIELDELRLWIQAEDAADCLEKLVRRAMLR